MIRLTPFTVAVLLVAACGGDDGGTTADAPTVDAASTKVQTVTCPATPDATVTVNASGTAYSPPDTPLAVNGIVKFVMPSIHNAQPNTQTTTDPGLMVGFGETKCLTFTQAGVYGFFCTAHGFAGTITVN